MKSFLLSLVSNFCIQTTFLCHVVRSYALCSNFYISNQFFGSSKVTNNMVLMYFTVIFQETMKQLLWIKCTVLREKSSLNILLSCVVRIFHMFSFWENRDLILKSTITKYFLTYPIYSSDMVELFTEVYNWLPLAHLINNKVMVGYKHTKI